MWSKMDDCAPAAHSSLKRGLMVALVMGAISVVADRADAIPTFAAQTGQACSACHVGGFGPQLTPFGREFKLQGYTLRTSSSIPLSVMAIASYLHTSKAQSPPAHHFDTNDNVALDQVSGFLAGGIDKHFGGFIQATYSGTDEVFTWDNLDLRAINHVTLMGKDTVIGATVNNSPGVQDVWNTLGAWGFPYTSSALAPSPTASPLIAGGLAQAALGGSAYLWWNQSLYAELGMYASPSVPFLKTVGVRATDIAEIKDAAPYGRIAYQKGNFEVGAFGLSANLYPGFDKSPGVTDDFADLGLDASYQWSGDAGRAFTVNARYTHEAEHLKWSVANFGASNAKDSLNDLRADASYYSSRGYGVTLGAFDTWGSKDAALYSGSAKGSPNSAGLILQADYTPWRNGGSPFGQRFNTRLGVQLTHYLQFDGASHNYDGAGADASDNDAVRVFAWVAY